MSNGSLHLVCEAEVIDKDSKGRSRGSHIESNTTSEGYDSGNASKESLALATAIATHYYGSSPGDAAATAQAERAAPRILNAFLVHHKLPPGARLELTSNVLDSFFAQA